MSDDETTDDDRIGTLRLLVGMLRERGLANALAGVLAEELYEACGGDAGKGAGMVLAVGARRKAKPPAASS
jgi:hypothetical protein